MYNQIRKQKNSSLNNCCFLFIFLSSLVCSIKNICAGYIGLEPITIGNYRASLEVCPISAFGEVGSRFWRQNETNETRNSPCLILENKTDKCLKMSKYHLYKANLGLRQTLIKDDWKV